jgi:hypothetical protein
VLSRSQRAFNRRCIIRSRLRCAASSRNSRALQAPQPRAVLVHTDTVRDRRHTAQVVHRPHPGGRTTPEALQAFLSAGPTRADPVAAAALGVAEHAVRVVPVVGSAAVLPELLGERRLSAWPFHYGSRGCCTPWVGVRADALRDTSPLEDLVQDHEVRLTLCGPCVLSIAPPALLDLHRKVTQLGFRNLRRDEVPGIQGSAKEACGWPRAVTSSPASQGSDAEAYAQPQRTANPSFREFR